MGELEKASKESIYGDVVLQKRDQPWDCRRSKQPVSIQDETPTEATCLTISKAHPHKHVRTCTW